MLTEIAVVENTIAGLTYATFAKKEQALRAVLYSLAVIGEAVASSSDALEAANPKYEPMIFDLESCSLRVQGTHIFTHWQSAALA